MWVLVLLSEKENTLIFMGGGVLNSAFTQNFSAFLIEGHKDFQSFALPTELRHPICLNT